MNKYLGISLSIIVVVAIVLTCYFIGINGQFFDKNILATVIGVTLRPVSCSETDNGLDYFKAGITTITYNNGYKRVEKDFCNASGTLREWYCGQVRDPAGLLRSDNYYKCLDGCKNGACNSRPKDIYIIEDDGNGKMIQSTGQVDLIQVAKKFYDLNPTQKDTYDLVSIFTTFPDPISISGHVPLEFGVRGIGRDDAISSDDLPKKLLGINFLEDTYDPKYNPSEDILKRNLFILNHETGHQWLAYLGRDDGISDGSHYTKWTNVGFLRDGKWQGDVMSVSGSSWSQNGDGTFSVNNVSYQAFSKLSLYLMGLIPASEVPDVQVIIPVDLNNQSFQNVAGTLKTIKMSDIVAKYGAREPSYQNSQKNFKMAYILLIRKNENNYQPFLQVVGWIAKNFPVEWSYITYGKSRINQ